MSLAVIETRMTDLDLKVQKVGDDRIVVDFPIPDITLQLNIHYIASTRREGAPLYSVVLWRNATRQVLGKVVLASSEEAADVAQMVAVPLKLLMMSRSSALDMIDEVVSFGAFVREKLAEEGHREEE